MPDERHLDPGRGPSRPLPRCQEPGPKSTVDVVGAITGLDINQSVVINLRGFRALVDAMGGVDVNVQQRVCVECHTGTSGGIVFTGDKQEYIEPGLRHLDGKHALWYARSRAGSDDFSRMRRQRCVAGALMQQADPVGLLQRYPQLAKVVKTNVSIDIPRDELSAWVDLALRIQKGGSIRSLPLTADVVPPGQPRLREDPGAGQEGPEGSGAHPEHLGLARPDAFEEAPSPQAHAPPRPPRPTTPRPCRSPRPAGVPPPRGPLARGSPSRPALESRRRADAVRPPPVGRRPDLADPCPPPQGRDTTRRRLAGGGTASCLTTEPLRDLSGIDSTLVGLS